MFTGDWNAGALAQLAQYPIVTIEKWMGALASCRAGGMGPCCGAAGECVEDAIVRNFKALKAVNKNVSTVCTPAVLGPFPMQLPVVLFCSILSYLQHSDCKC